MTQLRVYLRIETLQRQFAAYMAVSNLAYSIGAFWYASLVDTNTLETMFGWFTACMAIALPCWFFAFNRYLDDQRPMTDQAG